MKRILLSLLVALGLTTTARAIPSIGLLVIQDEWDITIDATVIDPPANSILQGMDFNSHVITDGDVLHWEAKWKYNFIHYGLSDNTITVIIDGHPYDSVPFFIYQPTVPEPVPDRGSTLALLGCAIVGLLGIRNHRRILTLS